MLAMIRQPFEMEMVIGVVDGSKKFSRMIQITARVEVM